jgi:alpha-tubulin suppressor-like RCC1 family protein
MNIVEIVKVLQDKINNSTVSEEVIYLSKILEVLNVGVVKTVDTYSDLLSITPQLPEIYFVEDEINLYYFGGGRWFLLLDVITLGLNSWGLATSGQLGDGTLVTKSSPVSVVGGFTDWTSSAAADTHSLAIRANGTLWSWGYNLAGQVGDNTSVNKSSPVLVAGNFTDWIDASAGGTHSFGIRSNGTLWAWGVNSSGKLGDNTIVDKSSPVLVAGDFNDWIQASAGRFHSLGLRANGSLWAWGNNGQGRLGDNTTTNKSSPVSVVGGITDWIQVSAGTHSLGVRANGSLWAWGNNDAGRLGDNTVVHRSSPVSVVGGFTDWIQVSAGNQFSLGVRANGSLWAWGNNAFGRLGDNTTASKSSPVSVVGGFTDWIDASAGGTHSFGIRSNGTLWAWGDNAYGRLGDNTVVNKSSPVSVVGGFTTWVQASAGNGQSLAIRQNL